MPLGKRLKVVVGNRVTRVRSVSYQRESTVEDSLSLATWVQCNYLTVMEVYLQVSASAQATCLIYLNKIG